MVRRVSDRPNALIGWPIGDCSPINSDLRLPCSLIATRCVCVFIRKQLNVRCVNLMCVRSSGAQSRRSRSTTPFDFKTKFPFAHFKLFLKFFSNSLKTVSADLQAFVGTPFYNWYHLTAPASHAHRSDPSSVFILVKFVAAVLRLVYYEWQVCLNV